jgi:hypothetical protein
MADEKRPDEGKQEDVEGHLSRVREDQTGDDTEGHRLVTEDQTGDDTEGHRLVTEDQTGDDVEGHRAPRPT